MPAETREQSASVGEEIRGPGKGLVLATNSACTLEDHSGFGEGCVGSLGIAVSSTVMWTGTGCLFD